MRITVVYQYFGTKKSGWSTRFYDFAIEWVRKGYDVRIITSPYYKSDIKTNRFYTNKSIDGIKISIINTPDSNLHSFWRRAINSLIFSISTSILVLFDRANTIVFSSGPVTVLIPFFFKEYFQENNLLWNIEIFGQMELLKWVC